MAQFQSLGVTPGVEHLKRPEFFQAGTKIRLLMNHNDPEYTTQDECLYNFLMAGTEQQKYRANPEHIKVSQRILKRRRTPAARQSNHIAHFKAGTAMGAARATPIWQRD